MNPGHPYRHEKGAIEILEEAAHLLRLAPVSAWLCYYFGTLPFVLGVLFFWADMSSSGSARHHLTQASLGLTFLFIWMKCWQALFASKLHEFLVNVPCSGWTLRRFAQMIGVQMAVMPWKIIALPLAMLITLPFGWCYAFFHNLTVYGNGEGDLRASVRQAWRQSALWPLQNHKLILLFTLFVPFVFMNLCAAAYMLPMLLRGLLGMETLFTRSNQYLFDTTFWLSMTGIAYLCVNPLILSSYVLRCYYGGALSSGEDLLAELRRLHRGAGLKPVLIAAALLFLVHVPHSLSAGQEVMGSAGSSGSEGGVSAERLDKAITEVINDLEYTWRLPRGELEEPKKSSGGFLAEVWKTVGEWLRRLWSWIKEAVQWVAEWISKSIPAQKAKNPSGWEGFGGVRLWLVLLLVACLGATGLMLKRALRRRKARITGTPQPEPSAEITPDLNDEDVRADELPALRWLALAKELLAKGEVRLAMRALYFAALTHLAERNLLTIVKSKSNREYERELMRRAHAFPDLIRSFSGNVTMLERVWYGMHEIRRDMVQQFLANHKRIMADVQDR